MKNFLILILFSVMGLAQTPPPPGGGPDDSFSGPSGATPIDGSMLLLFLLALSLGAYFMLRRKRISLVK